MADAVPTGRELEALKVLWDRGKATVREIYQEMKPQGGEGELAYTTVLSLLQTMEQKGLVGHESAGKAYLYFAGRIATAPFAISPAASLTRYSTVRWVNTWPGHSSRGGRRWPSWKRSSG